MTEMTIVQEDEWYEDDLESAEYYEYPNIVISSWSADEPRRMSADDILNLTSLEKVPVCSLLS